MRKALLVCLMCTISLSGFCQFFNANHVCPKPGKPGYPLQSDLTLSAIFNTPMTDVEEIAKITSKYFVQDSLLDFVQWDENSATNTVHFSLRRGQYKTTCMGATLVRNPVVLDFSINFQFVEGQMQMTFTDFSSKVYAFADKDKNLIYKIDDFTEADKRVWEEYKTILTTSEALDKFAASKFGQFIASDNASINVRITSKGVETTTSLDLPENYLKNIQERQNIRNNLNEQFSRYNDAVRDGHLQLISLDNMGQYKSPNPMWNQSIETHKQNNWVLGVSFDCFIDYFSEILMSYFSEISYLIKGEFEGVAINGVELFEKDADGKVRPVDPKQKKQWLKENRFL